jgi:site-specific recombinase XerC
LEYAGHLDDAGKSARTIQAYLAAIKGVAKWLAENQKVPRNPPASVRKPNPKADLRRERWMLLPEEWRLLQAATEAGSDRYAIPFRFARALSSNEVGICPAGRVLSSSRAP